MPPAEGAQDREGDRLGDDERSVRGVDQVAHAAEPDSGIDDTAQADPDEAPAGESRIARNGVRQGGGAARGGPAQTRQPADPQRRPREVDQHARDGEVMAARIRCVSSERLRYEGSQREDEGDQANPWAENPGEAYGDGG